MSSGEISSLNLKLICRTTEITRIVFVFVSHTPRRSVAHSHTHRYATLYYMYSLIAKLCMGATLAWFFIRITFIHHARWYLFDKMLYIFISDGREYYIHIHIYIYIYEMPRCSQPRLSAYKNRVVHIHIGSIPVCWVERECQYIFRDHSYMLYDYAQCPCPLRQAIQYIQKKTFFFHPPKIPWTHATYSPVHIERTSQYNVHDICFWQISILFTVIFQKKKGKKNAHTLTHVHLLYAHGVK